MIDPQQAVVNALRSNLGSVNTEKTYVDKLLAKDDIKELSSKLLAKRLFDREDINLIQALLNSSELKLTNVSKEMRYVHNKYYCWIEEAIAIYNMYLDYKEGDLYKKMDFSQKKLYDDTLSIWTSAVKQMAYLYFHLVRSSISLGGWGFDKLLSSKTEIVYDQSVKQLEPEKRSFWSR